MAVFDYCRSLLPNDVVVGYKGFWNDMTCRGF